MHIVYDFDGTLFALTQYFSAWSQALSETFNLSLEDVERAEQSVVTSGFTLEKHGIALGLSGKPFQKFVDQFEKRLREQGETLLFSDVMPHLEDYTGASKRTLLTYGDEEFQHLKIDAVGIGEHFDHIRIANAEETKVKHLREILEGAADPIIFIDDSPNHLVAVHEAGLPVTLVRIRREEETRHADAHPFDDDKWAVVRDLEEFEQTI